MLKLVESYDELGCFDETDNIFVIKAAANFLTYHGNANHSLWQQEDSALISIIDGSAVIWADKNADFEEISSFLRHSNLYNVFTDKYAAEKSALDIQSSGVIMKLTRSGSYDITSGRSKCGYQPFAKYSAVYSLLEKCGFMLPEKDTFIADLSYRKHCKTARIFDDDEYVSTAFTGFETAHSAIISAVAVDENKRRHGIGSDCLSSLCTALIKENKSVYLYREKDRNEQFYISNGFENIGEFVNCKYR